MNIQTVKRPSMTGQQQGLSLVELMVALTIGMLMIGAVTALYLSQRQSYRLSENVGRVQEGARLAFEMMSRDLREAGHSGCSNSKYIVNVLDGSVNAWWADFSTPLRGYDGDEAIRERPFGTNAGDRVNGTDALVIVRSASNRATVVSHDTASATFEVSTRAHGLSKGDIVLACDYQQGSIFQVSAVNSTSPEIKHAANVGTPGNCSIGLKYSDPPDCTGTGESYRYEPNSQIARIDSAIWYIGDNRRPSSGSGGGVSLYRMSLKNQGVAGTHSVAEELMEGVQNMSIEYLLRGATTYVSAKKVTDWSAVIAARITLTFIGDDRGVTTNGGTNRLVRKLTHVVMLRNPAS